MRVSAIDIGTNSVRQLICDVEDGSLIRLRKDVKITRLGEGLIKTGKLNPSAVQRTLETIEEFISMAEKEGVSEIYAFATSAMREAKNKDLFLDNFSKFDIALDILDGDTESLFGYIGAVKGIKLDKALVIDIGGGSTELAYKGFEFIKESFGIGAVKLTEEFLKSDPPSLEEYNDMRLYIIDTVVNSIGKYNEIERLVGIGGTITSLAAVSQQLEIYSEEKVHGYILEREEIKRILDRFISVSLEERKKIAGLQPERADIIIAGTTILLTLLEIFNKKEITVSEWDNLEGAALYKFGGVRI